jgi:hypothetical protein
MRWPGDQPIGCISVIGGARGRPGRSIRQPPAGRRGTQASAWVAGHSFIPFLLLFESNAALQKNRLKTIPGLAILCVAAMRLGRAVCFLGRFLPKLGGASAPPFFYACHPLLRRRRALTEPRPAAGFRTAGNRERHAAGPGRHAPRPCSRLSERRGDHPARAEGRGSPFLVSRRASRGRRS